MNSSVFKYILLSIMLLVVTAASAQQKSQHLLSQKTYKALNAVQELMTNEKYSQAETQLLALVDKTKAASYERAVIQQTLGYLYSSTDRYKKATQQFQQALDSEALPEQVSHTLRYNLAQLLIAEQRYKAGIVLLKKWIETEPSPPNDAHVLLASAYYYVKQFKETVHHLSLAINNTKSPQEVWYQVLMSAHMELKQYRSAIKIVEILISDFPYQKNYWQQLSALYLQQNKDFSALAVRALMQKVELGDSRVLNSLVDMYRYLHVPYKSGELLANAMEDGVIESNQKNLNRLADSWIAARELTKAAGVLKQVAKLDSSGEADLKYGRVLFNLEQWQRAVEALSQSLIELKGKQLGSAALWSGMAHFHLGEFAKAKTLFTQAASYKREHNQAQYWLNYLEQQFVK